MAQPLFIEVTDATTQQTRIVGIAHIADILHGEDGGAVIVKQDMAKFATVESYEIIKQTLGALWGGESR